MKLKITRIVGYPTKILSTYAIYIPYEYMHFYSINEQHDKIIRDENEHSILYKPYQERELKMNEKVVSISHGLTYLPRLWVKKNDLKVNELVYLIGTHDGLLIHPQK